MVNSLTLYNDSRIRIEKILFKVFIAFKVNPFVEYPFGQEKNYYYTLIIFFFLIKYL